MTIQELTTHINTFKQIDNHIYFDIPDDNRYIKQLLIEKVKVNPEWSSKRRMRKASYEFDYDKFLNNKMNFSEEIRKIEISINACFSINECVINHILDEWKLIAIHFTPMIIDPIKYKRYSGLVIDYACE